MLSSQFSTRVSTSTLLFLLLSTGCLEVKTYRPPPPGGTTEAAVSFSELEQRADLLLAETEDGDQRDRLLEAKDLMVALRGADPVAQRATARYLDRLLAIEERGRTQTIPADLPADPLGSTDVLTPVRTGGIEEVPLSAPTAPMTAIPGAPLPLTGPLVAPVNAPVIGPAATALTAGKSAPAEAPPAASAAATPPKESAPAAPAPAAPAPAVTPPAEPTLTPPAPNTPLATAQAAFDAKKWREALAALDGQTGAAADSLRTRSIDALIRDERERAGHLVVEARSMPTGAARTQKIQEAAAILEKLLADYPDSALAGELRENLELVRGTK